MIIGVPREIKNHEYRVSMLPAGVRVLSESQHRVLVEKAAGAGAGIRDEEYAVAGAEIVARVEEIFERAEMIVKVKEPLPAEYPRLRNGQILLCYLHLAPAPALTRALLKQKVIGIAYETVQMDNGLLPLLIPMSEIAGKLSVQAGAHYLERQNGGSGILLGGVPGVKPGRVTIVGGGTVGTNAAKIALGMGAEVTILDINLERLRYLSEVFADRRVRLLAANAGNIENAVMEADLVIGALLIPGAKAKKAVSRGMVVKMHPGSVMVDVAIDQGGCFETSVPTTFDKPVFVVEGVIHYCVTNIPASVSQTATIAITDASFPYIQKIATLGYRKACQEDTALRKGINVFQGWLTNRPVAEAVGIEYTPYTPDLTVRV